MNILTLIKNCQVEWKKLWEVTIWDKKFNAVPKEKQPKIEKHYYFLASDLKKLAVQDGNVKLLTTNISDLWTTEELAGDKINEGEIIAIPWGGNPIVQYYKGKYITADNRIATSSDKNVLDNKFLYYFLLSRIDLISSFYRGSGIKHPSMFDVLEMQIPIPPLDIQEKIVRILDDFTELTAELTAELAAELTARQKQYQYYRDFLLDCDNPKNPFLKGLKVGWKSLGEILVRTKGTKITAGQMKELHQENAPIKIFAGGKTFAMVNYDDIPEKDINRNPSIIVKSRGIIEFEYYDKPFSHKNEMWSYHSQNSEINIKFVYYFLKQNEPYFQNIGSRMQMPQIATPDTDKFKIPIPPLEIQAQIVAILDKFDTLTHSISEGLPREIELRQKQYEYYRELLLDFT